MPYNMDKDLAVGLQLINEENKIDAGLKLLNQSARFGTTKGKSFFEIANIVRNGLKGLKPDIEQARKYYDVAMLYFKAEEKDSMDYREMGDYYYYGLGTEPIDKNLALEYYKLAFDDSIAQERVAEIEKQLSKGDSSSSPALTENTEAKENIPDDLSNNTTNIFVAPIISDENKPADISDRIIASEVDADQILIKVIRILDSVSTTKQEKIDAVELCKVAVENGSLRACVLMGYLYEGDNELVETDFDKAKEYYELAIEHGSCSAKFRLGILYTDPDTTYYDLEKGHNLIIDAAHDGYTFALQYLGDCFRLKVDDTRNLDVAYRYYALAAERGLGIGYHNMAEIDASKQQTDLASKHEKLAIDNGYDVKLGYQDPLFYSLHI